MQPVENPHILELAKPLTHVPTVLSSYRTLQKQVSMGYVEGINIINHIHRVTLSHQYHAEPRRIKCKNLLTSYDKSVYSKISYENSNNGIVVVDDTYAISGALHSSMLNQMPSNISMRTVMPVRKKLEHKAYSDVTEKPILYEFYAKNRLSYWVTIQNNASVARLLLSIQEYHNESIPTAKFRWEDDTGLQVKTYLELEDDTHLPIHLINAGWDEIIEHAQKHTPFGIEIIQPGKKKQHFIISFVGIRESKKMGRNGYFGYGLRNNALSQEPKKEDTCIQRSDRSATRFLYNNENKIAVVLVGLALLLLYKYHSCLFFGITH